MSKFRILLNGVCLAAVIAASVVGCASTGTSGPRPHTQINFESGWPSNMLNWGEDLGSGSSVQDGASYDGSKALVVKAGGEGGAGIMHGEYGVVFELQPRTTYRLSAWGRNSAPASPPSEVGVKWKVDPRDEEEYPQFIFFEGDEWQEGSVTFTTPLIMTNTALFIWKPDPEVEFFVDNILLVRE